MNVSQLESVARSLVLEGKGILAADESLGTIGKRFKAVGVESSEEMRRAYREMLFTAPDIERWISGVILFDETIHQSASRGTPFPALLASRGIFPGIKVDRGALPLAGFPDERVTEGLDGLRDRLTHYRELGAKFTKWRAVITIGAGIPSRACLETNAESLARFATLSQEAALVPIVEPEVLMDGDHDIHRCEQVTEASLRTVFERLREQRVLLEGMLLKPNMVISGKGCKEQATAAQVATATLRCLHRTVPSAVPGIVFLSGGQSPEQATENLNAMNALGPHPWQISFSYARALQGPPLEAWRGHPDHVRRAQQLFAFRAKCNAAARYGTYSKDLEAKAA